MAMEDSFKVSVLLIAPLPIAIPAIPLAVAAAPKASELAPMPLH